eukprot:6294511-Heterocapsa_arctica.AAC.1
MEQIIRRPMAFQGLTRKEARNVEVPEGDFVQKEGSLDEQLKRWSDSSENYLGQVEYKLGRDHKGRGEHLVLLSKHNKRSSRQQLWFCHHCRYEEATSHFEYNEKTHDSCQQRERTRTRSFCVAI